MDSNYAQTPIHYKYYELLGEYQDVRNAKISKLYVLPVEV